MSNARLTELFGSNVFNDRVMKERLPKDIYASLQKSINTDEPLSPEVANVVANAMKDWALEKGATHYTHWFQPMTGMTAEKHDAFIAPAPDGKVALEFSGKELIKGEPDASSFPSGGLRATFEARGYTAWDPTSYAFYKENTLYIPTAFCSYGGEVLDKKTPLLRSMDVISRQALRVLKFFGVAAERVVSYVGPEQEYFLVDAQSYKKRKDLQVCGRTLFGAKPPKGQELEDHYFGSLKERVSSFMKEVDEELWKLGVYAKTEHNEVAPAQHEIAPVYGTTNVATDHNQLTMEMLKKVAGRHGLVCLLHEKPFAGVNGSGKHNNWSIGTDTGKNLLRPGRNPLQNRRFLLFLSAVIKAVDTYGDLLRVSVATAGNDHRLGANEAPPAIVSMFLGEELTAVLEAIEQEKDTITDKHSILSTGVGAIPVFDKDTTDRNRTSPFAFTGNKFEFRMPGSAQSVAGINIIINTIVAESLREFADRLEAAADPMAEVMLIVKETIKNHKRIIFNGNNYAAEWVVEAERRGLPNYRTCVDALPAFVSEKNEAVFVKHGIFSKTEVHARYEIMVEDYSKAINIEALTMLDMSKKEIYPAGLSYTGELLADLALKKSVGIPCERETALAAKLSGLCESLLDKIEALDSAMLGTKEAGDVIGTARFYRESVFSAMQNLRAVSDELETLVSAKHWPFPTYSELLFNI